MKKGAGEEEVPMVEDSEMTDDELITQLGQEYEEALLDEDTERIENDIAPRFWSRFAPYWHDYGFFWKSARPDGGVDDYVFDDRQQGRIEMEWMDQVLRGEIVLGDEVEEEPEQ